MPTKTPKVADMINSTDSKWDDTILPFQLDRSDIRGRVARLDGVLDRILAQHDYPPAIEALVAEAVLLTALIGQTIKLRWKLSLQIRGDGGPVRMIATDFYGPTKEGKPARIRAYAHYDADLLEGASPAFAQFGGGIFGILIDQGKGMTPYQGITPLAGISLSDCAETYFAQSEQLPTRFSLAFGQSQQPGGAKSWRAGGIMLQHMPKASPEFIEVLSDDGLLSAGDLLADDDEENWTRANILLDSVEELELVGPYVGMTNLLYRLYHEERPRVFDPMPAKFGCTCSLDRVERSLSAVSEDDITEMTTEAGIITADCQFCGAHYELDPADLGQPAGA